MTVKGQGWTNESEMARRIAELEAERDRLREALEAIANDVEEWEKEFGSHLLGSIAGVAMTALEKIDND